jgi:pimeloyl-ACP methyl ester carboxylesterase
VIAADFQGHGRTNDIDRPLGTESLASDVLGLLEHLGVPQVDVFGFSVGGAVALHLTIRNPELIRKAIISSVPFHPDGDRPEFAAAGEMKVEMIAGTPMEAAYLAKSPHPDLEHLQGLLDKLGGYQSGDGWSEDDIRGIAAPTLYTVGDNDAVTLAHAVRFAQLRGGDVNGDFVGLPTSQFAVFPGTTHFNGMARTDLVTDVVLTFLDAS